MSAGWRGSIAGACTAGFAFVSLRSAWVSDESFAVLRVADNAWAGHGLSFNPGAADYGFMSPLWTLLTTVVRGGVGYPVLQPVVLGWLLSTLAVGLLATQIARSGWSSFATVFLMAGTKPLVDYATSGTETSLVYVLLAAVAWSLLRNRPAWTAGLLGALCITRYELVLLALPVLARREMWPSLRYALVLPLLWTAVAASVYGTAWPTPLIADLASGLSLDDRLRHGLGALLYAARFDPTAWGLVALGVGGLTTRALQPMALGGVLYGAWVVVSGGETEAGRELTPVWFVAALLASRAPLGPTAGGVSTLLALLVVDRSSPLLTSPTTPSRPVQYGIEDHRGSRIRGFALTSTRRLLHHRVRREAREARALGIPVARADVGTFGFFAGPTVRVIDLTGRTDPDLAARPARRVHGPRQILGLRAAPESPTPYFPGVDVYTEGESGLLGPIDPNGLAVQMIPARRAHPMLEVQGAAEVYYANGDDVLGPFEPGSLPVEQIEVLVVLPADPSDPPRVRNLTFGREDR